MGGATTTRFLMLLTTTSPTPLLLLHHRCPPLLRLARHRLPPSLSTILHRHYHSLPPSSSSPPSPNLNASHQSQSQTQTVSSSFPPHFSHPWPEWSNFVNALSSLGYFSEQFGYQIDGFHSVSSFPEDFLRAASACLAFSRDHDYLFGKLSRGDIEVVVENGTAFLFKNGEDSIRRMRLFLSSGDSSVVPNSDSDLMVDLMRILLSYASDPISSERREFESSVRNLLSELAHLSRNSLEANLSGSVKNQLLERHGQRSRPLKQEMKRGDWICLRCSFMNFARNLKCLECEEARPKRQLTGGEWECPQCDFYNYGKNLVCLRCDCKRPGQVPFGATNSGSGLEYGIKNNSNRDNIDSRLAENEEKAQRWFNKISQLDSTSDMSNAIGDEDFPEIMPLRKGVNRFVVSTRKTPLERRLVNAQDQRNTNNNANRVLDEILGRKLANSESDKAFSTEENQNAGMNTCSNSVPQEPDIPREKNSGFAPFVPLPADMFAKKSENVKIDEMGEAETDYGNSLSSGVAEQTGVSESNQCVSRGDHWEQPEKREDQTDKNGEDREETKQSKTWFSRVTEMYDVKDEEVPEIFPMRKGENRFVFSKKKDRSLTSPMYKRRMAMEQANNTNFVPFVPFPPDYFANKNTQQSGGVSSTNEAMDKSQESHQRNADNSGARTPEASTVTNIGNPSHKGSWNSKHSGENMDETETGEANEVQTSGNSRQNIVDRKLYPADNQSSGFARNGNISDSTDGMENLQQSFNDSQANRKDIGSKENSNETGNLRGTAPQQSENQDIRSSWSGKSLEGSLVKEPDPLDMSEEAKAERWFRRVAQIKDISELSQIPDEDFPSIMPMRKGVNRFVVSKRKTPLERRLTSTQYRKNLPNVTSDPVKESDQNS